jgi:ribbon-helix-helix CopG family protein
VRLAAPCIACPTVVSYILCMGKLVTVRLDPATAAELEREARRTSRSKSRIIREALVARFATTRANALAGLQKYAGTMKGPRDLSTSKRHLTGLGRHTR